LLITLFSHFETPDSFLSFLCFPLYFLSLSLLLLSLGNFLNLIFYNIYYIKIFIIFSLILIFKNLIECSSFKDFFKKHGCLPLSPYYVNNGLGWEDAFSFAFSSWFWTLTFILPYFIDCKTFNVSGLLSYNNVFMTSFCKAVSQWFCG
jgi:hypothetical protein